MLDAILEHYGTKGMKWGVRKRSIPRQGPSGDAQEAFRSLVKAKISGPEALTNAELGHLNNRLNLEQNYAKLSYNPSKLKKGLDQVGQLLKAGKTLDEAIKFSQGPTASLLFSKPTGKHFKK